MRTVDAHLHLWDLTRADYPWLGPHIETLHRTFALDEIAPALNARGVDGVVLVQAADNSEDTEHMLELARSRPEVLGVVAWAPLEDPEAAAPMIERFAATSDVVGIRNLIHERPDPGWVLRPEFDTGLGLVEDVDLTFDFVTASPEALVHVPELASRHPRLRIVVDHLGKPPIDGSRREMDVWRGLLADAAANPMVFAKISGLHAVTGDPARWTVDDLQPVIQDALEMFGATRLMFGGDWPVSLLAGGYARWWDAVIALTGSLDRRDREAILGGTASSVYRLSVDGHQRGVSA